MHRRVASVHCADAGAACEALAGLAEGTDWAEVRLDALWRGPPDPDAAADELARLVQATSVPLLATLRPRRQGGGFEGPEEVRLGLLVAAAKAGFQALDIEMDNAQPARLAAHLKQEGAQVAASLHAAAAPGREDGLRILAAMQDCPVDLHKLTFQATSYPDLLRALELAHNHAGRSGRPMVATTGMATASQRALLALAGNHATYGHAPGSPPAAPGQPALASIAAVWSHWGIGKGDLDAMTDWPRKWVAVLGTPVGHSLSPRIHNNALRAAGRMERCGALEVPASKGALHLTLNVASRIGLAAASVASPHKVDAAVVSACDGVAKAVGAANCIAFGRDGPRATNTDATALRRLLGERVDANAPAVVLGSGGAARAALWALRDIGAAARLSARDPQKGTQLAEAFGAKFTPWDRRGQLAGQAWVQATPIGMQPGDPSPVAAESLAGRPTLIELAYGPHPTALEAEARAAGCDVVDGRAFLVAQAADAWRFWFGAEPDLDAMRAALEDP